MTEKLYSHQLRPIRTTKYIISQCYVRNKQLIPKILRPLIEKKLFFLKKQGFDYYSSLGNNCLPATILKESGLRDFSGPFDWFSGIGFFGKVKLIETNFANFLNYDDLQFLNTTPNKQGHIDVKNLKTAAIFPHDFTSSSKCEFQEVQIKYLRRQHRLYKEMRGKNVLFLYAEYDQDYFDYLNNIEEVFSAALSIKKYLGLKKLSLVFCLRAEKDFDNVDIYQSDCCNIFIKRFNTTLVHQDSWNALSDVNNQARAVIEIAQQCS